MNSFYMCKKYKEDTCGGCVRNILELRNSQINITSSITYK